MLTIINKPPSPVLLLLLLRQLSSLQHPPQTKQQWQRQRQRQRQGEAEDEELSKRISRIVLAHSNSTPSTLLSTLRSCLPPTPSPSLVNRTLKLLWNDAPCALLFLDSLLLLPRFCPHSSSLSLSLDLAARLRSKPSLNRLLPLLPSPLPPLALSSLAERPLSSPRAVSFFLRSLPQEADPLPSLNHLLRALSSSGRVDAAHSLLRSLRRRVPPDAFSYHAVAHGWCLRRLPNRAADALAEMVRSGIPPTTASYNILLHGFFIAGRPDRALELFHQMKKRGTTPDVFSYTIVAHGLGLAGRVAHARKVFDEMRGRGIAPTVASYNALIQVLCKKDSVENAVAVLEEMVEDGCVPNSITYNAIIKGICCSGDLKGGVEFMRRMLGGGWKPNVQTYNILIRCLTEEGEIEKGLELFGEMWEVGGCLPDKDTYNVLISAMFVRKRGEDMVMAGRLVMEMVERGHVPRRFMFNRVLNGLLLTGNQEFARELLRVHSSCPRLRKEVML